jgi:cell division protease FtsH
MQKPYSETTAEKIDKEISKIIEGQYQRAIELLRSNREKLDQLAQLLLDKEVIFKENVKEIFGPRPWDKEDEVVEEAVEVEITEAEAPAEEASAPAPTEEDTPAAE